MMARAILETDLGVLEDCAQLPFVVIYITTVVTASDLVLKKAFSAYLGVKTTGYPLGIFPDFS